MRLTGNEAEASRLWHYSNNVLPTSSYHEWCRSSNFSGGIDRKQLEAEIRL
jgi:hypothetical protein